jgi:aminoglycoside phosphotransferase family enzyme
MALQFQDTLNYLSQAAAWPDPAGSVLVRDTHWSVVFLTDRHAYKLKKPIRRASVDFTTVRSRHANCVAEIQLNRRLAPKVYLGLVALQQSNDGLLLQDLTLPHSQGEGPAHANVIDWLVKMLRLPASSMLDQILRAGALQHHDIVAVARVLSDFYTRTAPIRITGSAYRAQQEQALGSACQALRAPDYRQDEALIDAIQSAQQHFLRMHATLLEARAAAGRILETHGDLRPEHVCLAGAPVFIDCLEFDRHLRIADPADELAGLAMECDFLGAPQVQPWLFEAYRQASGDAVSMQLVRFYSVQRALMRARMAAWHLDDPISDTLRAHWRTRASAFLQLAWAQLQATD